jgi:hypothetical protein
MELLCLQCVQRADRRNTSLDTFGPHRIIRGASVTGQSVGHTGQLSQSRGVACRISPSLGISGGVISIAQPSQPNLARVPYSF